ncbi:MAG: DUF4129 domain-containing protein [Nocardioides sp.]
MTVRTTGRRTGAVATAAVVAAALLVVVLAAWAATSGPSGVLTGEGFDPAGTPSQAPTATASSDTGTAPSETEPPPDVEVKPWVRALATVLRVVVLLLVASVLVRYLLLPLVRWLVGRRFARQSAQDPDFVVLDPPQAVAREMAADASAQRQELLDTGSPRNAVVACWHRFETQAGAAGVERHPWETSSEYTMRVLDLVDAHQPAVSGLAALYREARFSEHELTEEHRHEAVAALDAVHRTIGISA